MFKVFSGNDLGSGFTFTMVWDWLSNPIGKELQVSKVLLLKHSNENSDKYMINIT